jgi:hypothetical protein
MRWRTCHLERLFAGFQQRVGEAGTWVNGYITCFYFLGLFFFTFVFFGPSLDELVTGVRAFTDVTNMSMVKRVRHYYYIDGVFQETRGGRHAELPHIQGNIDRLGQNLRIQSAVRLLPAIGLSWFST